MLSSAAQARSLTNDILLPGNRERIFSKILAGILQIPQHEKSLNMPEMLAITKKKRAELEKLNDAMQVNAIEDIARHFETILFGAMLNRLLKSNDEEITKNIIPIFFKSPKKLTDTQLTLLKTLIVSHAKIELAKHAASFYLHCLKEENDISMKIEAFVENAKNRTLTSQEVIFPILDCNLLTEEEYHRVFCHTLILINNLNQATNLSDTNISGFEPANTDLKLIKEKLGISDDQYKKFYDKLKEYRDRFDALKKENNLVTNLECKKILENYSSQHKNERPSVARTTSSGLGGPMARMAQLLHAEPKPKEVPQNASGTLHFSPYHSPDIGMIFSSGPTRPTRSTSNVDLVEERGREKDKKNAVTRTVRARSR